MGIPGWAVAAGYAALIVACAACIAVSRRRRERRELDVDYERLCDDARARGQL